MPDVLAEPGAQVPFIGDEQPVGALARTIRIQRYLARPPLIRPRPAIAQAPAMLALVDTVRKASGHLGNIHALLEAVSRQ